MNGTDVARGSFHHSRRTIAIAMGSSLAVSGGIHAVVVSPHLREWWVAGAFFIAAAIVQAVCAYAVLVWRDTRGARAGAAVSALLVAIWTISRTVGIPIGPGRGVREAVAVLDVLATSAEIFAVVAFLALKSLRLPSGLVSRMSRVLAVMVVGLTFGLGAATAAAMPRHRHSHDAIESSASQHPDSAPRRAPARGAPTNSPHPGDEGHPHGTRAHKHPEER